MEAAWPPIRGKIFEAPAPSKREHVGFLCPHALMKSSHGNT